MKKKFFKRSVIYKIFFGSFLVTFLILILILIYSFGIIKNYFLDTVTKDLVDINIASRNEILPFLVSGKYEEMDVFVKKLGKELHARLTVINTNGVVLADSLKDPKEMENHLRRIEFLHAMKGETGHSEHFSETIGKEMFYIANPIEENGKIAGVIRSSLYVKDLELLLNKINIRLVWAGIVLIIISLVTVFFILSRDLFLPLNKINDALRQVSKGNFLVRIFFKKDDEFKEIADHFNEMVYHIDSLFKELKNQKDEIFAIINSLEEGLVVLDKNGKIVLSNNTFNSISGDPKPDGKYHWAVFRNLGFNELINGIKNERKSAAAELELFEKVFLCFASFIPSRDEVVVIWHDITDIKNLEKIKKDFVVNVSHELRTPLTAIKGFVETLLEDGMENGKKYLDIILRHTNRMISIVNDLLSLSELEDDKSVPVFSKVNLKNILDGVLIIFNKRIAEKGLKMNLKITPDVPVVSGDIFRLEQLFINLIDNAVKYTEEGEISVSAEKTGNLVKVIVEDTGIGIPSKDLPRIFERFYTVDKSRSRKMGGTGLGLSIVRHIVILHNGTISVESHEGKGTKFIIDFPLIKA